MNRILLSLAVGNYLLVAIAVYTGLLSEPAANPVLLGDGAFGYHFRLGLTTAIYSLFTHCLVFTYFLGANRWVREVTEAYKLGDALPLESRRLRSRAFAMAVVSMLLVVAAIATGAGAHTKIWPKALHQAVPGLVYAFMLYAYWVEYHAIERHTVLTNNVMEGVERIRRERGLPALSELPA